jgi:hypothetical protein
MSLNTVSEVHQRVLEAAVPVLKNQIPLLEGENGEIDTIVRVSGVPIGHVREVLSEYQISGLYHSGGGLHYSQASLDAMEAHVLMPLSR